MNSTRHMKAQERVLLEALLRLTPQGPIHLSILDATAVSSMDDGGMGSFTLFPPNVPKDRHFGMELVMAQFEDTDGVPVSITVNLDNHGSLYEVDIWKTDNSPLISWPSPNSLKLVQHS